MREETLSESTIYTFWLRCLGAESPIDDDLIILQSFQISSLINAERCKSNSVLLRINSNGALHCYIRFFGLLRALGNRLPFLLYQMAICEGKSAPNGSFKDDLFLHSKNMLCESIIKGISFLPTTLTIIQYIHTHDQLMTPLSPTPSPHH